MQKPNVYEVTVEVKARIKVRTTAYSVDAAYDNVRSDFDNDPQDFLNQFDYEIDVDSYDEVDAVEQDEEW